MSRLGAVLLGVAIAAGGCVRSDTSGGLQLQAAIDAAAPGETLQLEPGTYRLSTPVRVDHDIVVLGSVDGTKIVVALDRVEVDARVGLRVAAGHVRLSGIDIETDDEGTTLVEVVEGRAEMTDMSLAGGRVGIEFSPAAGGEVSSSRFERSRFGVIVNGASVEVDGNEFARHQEGIVFSAASTAIARSNTVAESSNGILVQEDATPRLERNEITGCDGGIAFYEGAGGVATGNTVRNSQWGIDVRSPGPVTIADNTLSGNGAAIQFWVTGGTGDVVANTCEGNDRDIVLAGPDVPEIRDNGCETDHGAAHDPSG